MQLERTRGSGGGDDDDINDHNDHEDLDDLTGLSGKNGSSDAFRNDFHSLGTSLGGLSRLSS